MFLGEKFSLSTPKLFPITTVLLAPVGVFWLGLEIIEKLSIKTIESINITDAQTQWLKEMTIFGEILSSFVSEHLIFISEYYRTWTWGKSVPLFRSTYREMVDGGR